MLYKECLRPCTVQMWHPLREENKETDSESVKIKEKKFKISCCTALMVILFQDLFCVAMTRPVWAFMFGGCVDQILLNCNVKEDIFSPSKRPWWLYPIFFDFILSAPVVFALSAQAKICIYVSVCVINAMYWYCSCNNLDCWQVASSVFSQALNDLTVHHWVSNMKVIYFCLTARWEKSKIYWNIYTLSTRCTFISVYIMLCYSLNQSGSGTSQSNLVSLKDHPVTHSHTRMRTHKHTHTHTQRKFNVVEARGCQIILGTGKQKPGGLEAKTCGQGQKTEALTGVLMMKSQTQAGLGPGSQSKRKCRRVLHEGKEQSCSECAGNWSFYIGRVSGKQVWADWPDHNGAQWQVCPACSRAEWSGGVAEWAEWNWMNDLNQEMQTVTKKKNKTNSFVLQYAALLAVCQCIIS